jgi:hypothetical protein
MGTERVIGLETDDYVSDYFSKRRDFKKSRDIMIAFENIKTIVDKYNSFVENIEEFVNKDKSEIENLNIPDYETIEINFKDYPEIPFPFYKQMGRLVFKDNPIIRATIMIALSNTK